MRSSFLPQRVTFSHASTGHSLLPSKFSRMARLLLLAVSLSFGPSIEALAQTSTEKTLTYTVKAGETAYSIARRYGTTVSRLLQLNAGLAAEHIRSGQTIVVPAYPDLPAASVTPGVQQPHQTAVTYKEYKVKRKDTPYKIAKLNGINVEDLMNANPQLKEKDAKLKKGSVILVPLVVKEKTTEVTTRGLQTLRIAVILPMVGNGVEHARSIEFYRGMLLGMQPLKQAGVNLLVNTYNEPAPNTSIQPLLQNVVVQKPDVIVGPLYPTHFGDVTAVATQQMKVAIPFSSKVEQVNYRPHVFVLNTPLSYETTLALDLFKNSFTKNKHIVLIHTANGNKKGFTQALQQMGIAAGYSITPLAASATAAEMKTALANKPQGEFLFVPDDASEATLSQLLPKLKALRQLLPGARFSLMGYENWIALSEGNYKLPLHEADTYILSSTYFYPYTSAAKAFTAAYQRWYKSDFQPCRPLMAPLGYDFCRAFLGGLVTYGHSFATQAPQKGSVADAPTLQSDLRFASVGKGAGYVSRSMWLVHFKPDLSIIKIAAK